MMNLLNSKKWDDNMGKADLIKVTLLARRQGVI